MEHGNFSRNNTAGEMPSNLLDNFLLNDHQQTKEVSKVKEKEESFDDYSIGNLNTPKNSLNSLNEEEDSVFSRGNTNQSLNFTNKSKAIKSPHKKKKVSNVLISFLLLKKILFLILIFCGILSNFSILNMFYFFIGVIFIYNFEEKNTRDVKIKNILIGLSLFFSFVIIMFKITIVCIYRDGKWNESESNFYLNFGLIFFKGIDFKNIFLTFCLDFFIFAYSIMYRYTCWDLNKAEKTKDIKRYQIYLEKNKINFIHLILYMIGFPMILIRISFLSIFYSFFMHIGLLLKIFKKHLCFYYISLKIFKFFGIISIFLSYLININFIGDFAKTNNLINIFGFFGIFKIGQTVDLKELIFFSQYFLNFLFVITLCLIEVIKVFNKFDKKKTLKKNQNKISIIESVEKKYKENEYLESKSLGESSIKQNENLSIIEEEDKNKNSFIEEDEDVNEEEENDIEDENIDINENKTLSPSNNSLEKDEKYEISDDKFDLENLSSKNKTKFEEKEFFPENEIEEIFSDNSQNSSSSYESNIESEKNEKGGFIFYIYSFISMILQGIYKFYKKINSFLYAYFISAYFRLDVCRICIIYWIFVITNYQTIPLIIWLFFTIQSNSLKNINFVTFLLAWPSLIVNFYFFSIANINGLINIPEENKKIKIHYLIFGIEKFDTIPAFYFGFIHFTILAFSFLSFKLNENINSYENSPKIDKISEKNSHTNKIYQISILEIENQNEMSKSKIKENILVDDKDKNLQESLLKDNKSNNKEQISRKNSESKNQKEEFLDNFESKNILNFQIMIN